jgi:glycosyltransferase involved in cell wall biosynthesis
MTIAVYAIAKNESNNVESFMAQFKLQDVQVFVLDTGSTDDTVALLLEYGANVNTTSYSDFDFSIARNEALSFISADFEICMSIDLDERIEQGFVGKLETAFADPAVNCCTLDFVFSRDGNGHPAVSYSRRLAHRRDKGVWKYPVHEVLDCVGEEVHTSIVSEHFPDLDKERDYLPLLQRSAQQNPDDPRAWFYLGREYFMHHQQYGMAIEALEHAMACSTTDTNYLFDTLTYLGDCHKVLEDFDNAEHSYRQAIVIDGDRRDGLMALSQLYFDCGMVEEALGHSIRALRIQKPTTAMFVVHSALREWPYHMAAVCYHKLGMQSMADKYITWAVEVAPRDGLILADYATITGKLPPGLV